MFVLVSLRLLPAAPALTYQLESRIGRSLAEKLAKSAGIKATPQTVKIEAYLQRVGDRVAAKEPRHLRYHFRFDPDPSYKSAFALPGGEIFVGAGILAFLDSEDQLAAVLGHEIEHVALNHCRNRLEKVMNEQHLSLRQSSKLKAESFFEGYGHDGELLADREGVKLAVAAGYSPNGAVRLLELFLWISQHSTKPTSVSQAMLAERIAHLRALRDELHTPNTSPEIPLALP